MKVRQWMMALGVAGMLVSGGTMIGCDDDDAGDRVERAADRVEDSADKAADKVEDAGDRLKDKVD